MIRELCSILWGWNYAGDIIHYDAFENLIALANLAVIYWGLKYTYREVKSELRERKCIMAAGFYTHLRVLCLAKITAVRPANLRFPVDWVNRLNDMQYINNRVITL
jgi:hypothetical protein